LESIFISESPVIPDRKIGLILQVFYERVNSHAVASYFFYTLCGMRDVSREMVDLEKYPATKIKFTKGFIFANDATAAEFEEQRSTFFQVHFKRPFLRDHF